MIHKRPKDWTQTTYTSPKKRMKRTHSQPLETRNTQKGDAWTGHATNFTETAAGTSTGITPESRAFTGS
uniref:Uncharacterized protein n=1 Tax=Brassica oleracea TaxID=3712 RepID=A0A3P6GRQ6_BRAOL|nr:unnamed protein product [Brassica oleracea]